MCRPVPPQVWCSICTVAAVPGSGSEGLSDFDAVADVNNLLVAYPDGYDRSWADGRGASPADRHHVDDVGFLVALASKLVKDFGIALGARLRHRHVQRRVHGQQIGL